MAFKLNILETLSEEYHSNFNYLIKTKLQKNKVLCKISQNYFLAYYLILVTFVIFKNLKFF